MQQFKQGIERLSVHSLKALCKEGKEPNVFLSGSSIAVCLSMLTKAFSSGHAGQVELMQTLSAANSEVDSDAFIQSVKQYSKTLQDSFNEKTQILLANAVFAKSITNPDYIEHIQNDFAGLAAPLTTVDPINGFVKKATHGMIESIVPALDPTIVCVLINCIYFKGLWKDPFLPSHTQEGVFHSAAGPVPCKFMHTSKAAYGRTHFGTVAVHAVQLPYGDAGEYTAVVAMTENETDSMREAVEQASVQELVGLCEGTCHHSSQIDLDVRLPRFKAEFESSLVDTLQSFGLQQIFVGPLANLASDTCVSDVIHKAVLEVDEAGTKAAAATAIMVRATCAIVNKQYVHFRVDRPFLFIVHHKQCGPLFLGLLTSPKFT